MDHFKLKDEIFKLLVICCAVYYIAENIKHTEFKKDYSLLFRGNEISFHPVASSPINKNTSKTTTSEKMDQSEQNTSLLPSAGLPRKLNPELINDLIKNNKLSDKEAMFYKKR